MTQLRENRRQLLLRAAARLFREKGYARATIRDLAKAVALQSGSIFHYFDSKDDILLGVMQAAVSDAVTRLEDAYQAADGPEAGLRALVRAELSLMHEEATRDGMEVTFYEWDALMESSKQELLVLRERYEQTWAACLQEARDAKMIRQDPAIVRRFTAGALIWTAKWYRPGGELSMDDLTEQMVGLILHS